MIRKKLDWKEFLSPESEKTLKWILEKAKLHRGAYLNSDDVKTAQIWAALIEFTKYLQNFNERISRLEKALEGLDGVKDKNKEEIRESLEKF